MASNNLREQFEALSDLSQAQQLVALDQIAENDPQRADRLRFMLAADLAQRSAAEVEPALPSIAEALQGSLLDQRRSAFEASGFRPLRLLGRGGMGEVWLVERQVARLRQELALKLLQALPGANDLWLARFRTEQRILLELDHPGIARLVDAGEADGQPWIAMEFIDGQDVVSWCDAQRLDINARLRLFQQICAAVQYAHDRLIVHRDLKPVNILVNRRGEPKLLDFGIAKILDDPNGFRTGTAQSLFSLYGVAPEQLLGQGPTVTTDVYALGALLYELLCGREALQFEGLSLTGIERRVLHESPSLPSASVSVQSASTRGVGSAPALARQLRGDLDRIVLHALRKRSAERYASVREFSADIGRYLNQQPVLAAGQNRIYRTRKFLRRHAVGVSTAATVLALIAAFVVQLRLERDTAERARDGAQRVSEFLVRMFELGDPTRSLAREISAAEMLEQGFKQLDEQQLDARTGAPVLLAMARAAQGLGDPELIKQALLALRESKSGLAVQDQIETELIALELSTQTTDGVATQKLLAQLQRIERDQFSDSQAERLELLDIQISASQDGHQQAVERLRRHPSWSPAHEVRADLLQARSLYYLGDYAGVESVLAPLLTKIEGNPARTMEMVSILRLRAIAAGKRRQATKAIELMRQAQQLVDVRLGPEHLIAQNLRVSLADIYRHNKQAPQGIGLLIQTIPEIEQRLAPDHNMLVLARHNLIIMLGEHLLATPAQLALGRKLALADLANPAIENPAMRARYRMSLVKFDVIEGHLDAALARIREYRAQALPELSTPLRQAQLQGWEIVLGGGLKPTPERIRELIELQKNEDILLAPRLQALLEPATQAK